LDEETQYLKVRKGTRETTVPRKTSFCTHALEHGGLLVVPDTLRDSRFIANPMVTGGPRIRFFASMPLTMRDGQKIGTLYVLDDEVHDLDEHQEVMLRILSSQV
jgi:GAF domain-containing protein